MINARYWRLACLAIMLLFLTGLLVQACGDTAPPAVTPTATIRALPTPQLTAPLPQLTAPLPQLTVPAPVGTIEALDAIPDELVADLNGDCLVDITDFAIFRAQYGYTCDTWPPTPTATPGP